MTIFLPTLIGTTLGVLVVSVFLPTAQLRRRRKETLLIAVAGVFGAGVTGLAAGHGARGLLSGLGFALALIFAPWVVLAFRNSNASAHDGA